MLLAILVFFFGCKTINQRVKPWQANLRRTAQTKRRLLNLHFWRVTNRKPFSFSNPLWNSFQSSTQLLRFSPNYLNLSFYCVNLLIFFDYSSDIIYIVAVINEFAKTYHISVREANNYLIRFNGIDFLTEHYEAEHLLSLDDAIQDLTQVCLNNGGGIQWNYIMVLMLDVASGRILKIDKVLVF